MTSKIYFGKILDELYHLNSQGRLRDCSGVDRCYITNIRRTPHLVVTFSGVEFEYSLADGLHALFYNNELLPGGWDALTNSQQMSFIGELYEFMYFNKLTEYSLKEFIDYLSTPLT